MPLTRKQFDLGITNDIEECMKLIHAYLSEHRHLAFTMGELRDAIPYKKSEDFEVALAKLVVRGVVGERTVQHIRYYALGPNPLESFFS